MLIFSILVFCVYKFLVFESFFVASIVIHIDIFNAFKLFSHIQLLLKIIKNKKEPQQKNAKEVFQVIDKKFTNSFIFTL